MKSVTTCNLLNNIPIISITHKGLEAIKEIVRIAPQEAQWFHTVEPIVHKNSPNQIHLILSDKLYIPTQNTSTTQVDTTSMMMMDFYKDLQQEYDDQKTVNQKLSAMTCWCHSHHNMPPNPSKQDSLQFNSFISLANDQKSNTWQVMLIFNKKNQFYSRVYNPHTASIHEGVPIKLIDDYDFNYIHLAAKTKFKKPELKNKQNLWFMTSNTSKQVLEDTRSIDLEISAQILSDAFGCNPFNDLTATQRKKRILFTKEEAAKFFQSLGFSLDDREILLFAYLISNETQKALSIYTDKAFEKKLETTDYIDREGIILEEYLCYIQDKTFSLDALSSTLNDVLYLTELNTKKSYKEFFKEHGYT